MSQQKHSKFTNQANNRSRLHNRTADSSKKASSPSVDRPYISPSSRPSFRNGVAEQVFENAKRTSPDGRVRDPLTKEVIKWELSISPA